MWKFKQKIHMYAYKHPTAWIVFNDWFENGIWWYWAWWNKENWEVKFVLKKLIETHWREEGSRIYKAYNQALIDIRKSKYFDKEIETEEGKIVQADTACLVFYIPEDV